MNKVSRLLIVFLCICSFGAHGKKYYVAPTGSDTNAGTISSPFLTVQQGQAAAAAGDTVYLRGGTYTMQQAQIHSYSGIYAFVTLLNKSGTAGKPIRYWAYPGERPKFDFANVKPANYRVHAFEVTGSWIHLRGLEVVGVQVTITTGNTQSICFSQSGGGNNIYEQLSMHDGMAIGFYLTRGGNTLVLNCDAYNNRDNVSADKLGGNVDGFGAHPNKQGQGYTGIVFRGCRAWFNSDGCFDCINSCEAITFENCWAFYNGYSPTFQNLANGLGFKVGGFGVNNPPSGLANVPRHTVRHCLAVQNKSSGFYATHHLGGNDWYNNTAYQNATNFNMLNRHQDFSEDVAGFDHVLRNNVSLAPRSANAHIANFDAARCTIDHNTFLNTSVSVADNDFASLDKALLTQARKTGGDLPDIQFLVPARGSDLVDTGINVGLPYTGSAPDLGYREYRIPLGFKPAAPGASSLAIYPVPAGPVLHLRLPDRASKPVAISIFDEEGRQVNSRLIPATEPMDLNLQGLGAGVYVLEARYPGSKGMIGRARFVRQP